MDNLCNFPAHCSQGAPCGVISRSRLHGQRNGRRCLPSRSRPVRTVFGSQYLRNTPAIVDVGYDGSPLSQRSSGGIFAANALTASTVLPCLSSLIISWVVWWYVYRRQNSLLPACRSICAQWGYPKVCCVRSDRKGTMRCTRCCGQSPVSWVVEGER